MEYKSRFQQKIKREADLYLICELHLSLIINTATLALRVAYHGGITLYRDKLYIIGNIR